MNKASRTHHILVCAVCSICFLACLQVSVLSEEVSGTQEPAVYPEKKQILKREKRLRRSQAIQEAARLYREMVSSYKARRIIRAEELSQKLNVVLDDPVLPEAFAEKMKYKQQKFLKRIYGNKASVKMDIPVDDISDDEVAEIRKTVSSGDHSSSGPGAGYDRSSELLTASGLRPDKKKESPKDRASKKAAARAEKIKLAKQRRQERIAQKKKQREQYLKEKEERKLQRQRKKEIAKEISAKKAASKRPKEDEIQEDSHQDKIDKAPMDEEAVARRRELQAQRLLDYQEKFLGMDRDEIDHYIDLYQQEKAKERQRLQEELAEKVESLYQDGVEFFKKKAYHFAYDIFQEVEALHPDYQLTRQYLEELHKYFILEENGRSSGSAGNPPPRDKVISSTLDSYNP